MAAFYIQLKDKRLKISGDLTAENIYKAIGYVPSDFSGNYEDLKNKPKTFFGDFNNLSNNPLLQDNSGELDITDENGNIIAKINANGINSIDFIAGEHKLSEKANKSYVETTKSEIQDLVNEAKNPDNLISAVSIEKGGTGANNAEDACDNIGAVKKYDIFKTLSKEGWYRIGLLTAIMSTSSARIIVGGTNADVTPIIMDFQHNFRGNMLSQMPTVMTPLYVTKVRAVRYTSDDVYIDLYFTNVSSSHTTVRVIPYEGTFEPMNYIDVTNEAVTVLTSIDIIKDGFLADKLTKDEAETTYQPVGNYVTTDTEQTITSNKIINNADLSIQDSNGKKLKITKTGIQLQNLSQTSDAATTFSVQNAIGGSVFMRSHDLATKSNWGKKVYVTCRKNETQEEFGFFATVTGENKQMILGHLMPDGTTGNYAYMDVPGGNFINFITKDILIQNPTAVNSERNAVHFNWDNTTNTLDIKRAYYNNGSIETDDVKLTLNGKQVATITDVINHGTSDASFALTPNTYHIWGTMSSLTLTLSTPADTTVYNEYMFEFTSGSTATTLSLPSTIKWVDAPSIEANKTYQVSIVNNLGVIVGFSA